MTKSEQNYHDLPDLTSLYSLAYKCIDKLPKQIKRHAQNLIVRVENFASQEVLNSLSIKDKYDLLGLYRGIPLPRKHADYTMTLPDVIFLYRCPLIRFAFETEQAFIQVVNHVMIHEIGHHFGFNDEDMEWIEKNDG